MMKKKVISANYLESVPARNPEINWTEDEKGIVTLEVVNKGFFNKIAQKFFKRPRISYVHLDENGSFTWKLIDGERNIIAIGEAVDEHFGEAAHPLYESLATYFKTLESYRFVIMKK